MKKIILTAGLFLSAIGSAQNTYLDPTTTLALNGYSNQIRDEQNKTNERLTMLQKAQVALTAELGYVDIIQNKLLKGMSETSGIIQNGIKLKRIYQNLKDATLYLGEVGKYAKENPTYAVFAEGASTKVYEYSVQTGLEINEFITNGENNLMTAGDRQRLLEDVENKTRMLVIYVYNIKTAMKHAKTIGFWKSINPWQGYVNTDSRIVKGIMRDIDRLVWQ